jgi:hypothetical protein
MARTSYFLMRKWWWCLLPRQSSVGFL